AFHGVSPWRASNMRMMGAFPTGSASYRLTSSPGPAPARRRDTEGIMRPWNMLLARRVDASRGMPLYMQLIHALIHEIQRGRLTPGTFLPSSRELAAALGVNRKTVVLAYEDLIAQGWLEAL